MWEMFDFGHEASIKKLRETMNKLLKETDEERVTAGCKNPVGCDEVSQFANSVVTSTK